MASWSIREQQDSVSGPAGTSRVTTTPTLRDRTEVLLDVMRKRRELEDLNATVTERKQVMESLHQRVEEMQRKAEEAEELHRRVDMFNKTEHINQVLKKAERERKDRLEMEAAIERMKEELAELVERKQQLQCRVQRFSVYLDFIERAFKLTTYKDAQSLSAHLESLLQIRDQHVQKLSELQEQADQQRKALLTLEDHNRLRLLQKNTQLSQLHDELEKTRSETQTWEKKWNHIQETAAKKTLLLLQIKMAILNLHELTDDKEQVDINETDRQLDKIEMFIQDHEDILKRLKTSCQRHRGGQKSTEQREDEEKSHIATP